MIHLRHKPLLAALLVFACAAQVARGQALAPAEYPWYAGVQGGTAFGQGTFRSITEHQIRWGAQGGVFAGVGLNRLLSLELGVQTGAQSQFALDCCPYWLSEDGTRYFSPVLDRNGWYYQDLRTATQWGKVALQANVNLLSLLTKPGSRWALNVSPQIAAVTTHTTLVAPDRQIDHDRQWHLGWGGQATHASNTLSAPLLPTSSGTSTPAEPPSTRRPTLGLSTCPSSADQHLLTVGPCSAAPPHFQQAGRTQAPQLHWAQHSPPESLLEGGRPGVPDAACPLKRRGQVCVSISALRPCIRVSTLSQNQL